MDLLNYTSSLRTKSLQKETIGEKAMKSYLKFKKALMAEMKQNEPN